MTEIIIDNTDNQIVINTGTNQVEVDNNPGEPGPAGPEGQEGPAGPEGPRGPQGLSGGVEFVYTQIIASDTWTIVHNMGKFPAAVTVIDTANRVVYGEIDYVDENTIILYFTASFSGSAHLL